MMPYKGHTKPTTVAALPGSSPANPGSMGRAIAALIAT